MSVQVCPVCHMVLSGPGPCSICGSAPNQLENKDSAALESEAISLPFGLENLPESPPGVALPFGIEDAPNPSVDSSNSSEEVEGATEISDSAPKEPISVNENGRNKAIELPYGIDHMHDTLID